MKSVKFFLMIIVAAAAAFVSCDKESRVSVPGSDAKVQTLTACFAPGETKTAFVGGTYMWKTNDDIVVRSSNANGYSTFIYTGDDTNGEAIFTNTSEDVITYGQKSFAIYPGKVNGSYPCEEDGSLKVVLEDTYTWATGNVEAPMLARVESGEPLQFKHLGGCLKVTYKYIPPKATKLVIKAPVVDAELLAAGKNTYKICKTMNQTYNWTTAGGGFDLDPANVPYVKAYDHSGDYKITVNISAATAAQRASDEGVTVYIPLPVGPVVVSEKNVYPKIQMWLAFNDDSVVPGSLKTATNVQIERASIKPMQPIALTKYSVATIAGRNGTVQNDPTKKVNAEGTSAVFGNVRGLVLKDANTLYALDANCNIRKVDISPSGSYAVTTSYSETDKTNISVPWRGTMYNGKLYFADKDKSRLIEYTEGNTPENKKSLWGFPSSGNNKSPMDLQFDSEGYPYVPIRDAFKVYKLPKIFTGSTPAVFADFSSENAEITGGKDMQVSSICFDSSGNLLVLTINNGCCLFRVTPEGNIKKIAGVGTAAGSFDAVVDGNALTSATLTASMYGIAIDTDGSIFIGNRWCIRKITFGGPDYTEGIVTTIVGNTTTGIVDGVGGVASTKEVCDLVFNSDHSKLYFSEPNAGVIRVITIE